MNKAVNGRVVRIDNIELFKRAKEGLLNKSSVGTSINIKISSTDIINKINKFIEQYKVIYNSMPYPLYAVEEDIKYAVIAKFIKLCSKESIHTWVDKGLFILLDKTSKLTLNISKDTWRFVEIKVIPRDNTDIGNFKNSIGYSEYKWVLDKIISGENTGDYYSEHMAEFIKACDNDKDIIKKELNDILNFRSIPKKLKLKDNRIININNKSEYFLDIYQNELKETGENKYSISFIRSEANIELEPTYVMTYKCDVYEKKHMEQVAKTDTNKMEKIHLIGSQNILNILCGLKIVDNSTEFSTYRGIIEDCNLVFEVEGRIYICKAYRNSESKEIVRGAELYSIRKGIIYFIVKDEIYSYSIGNGGISLCGYNMQ